ncbi:hypothetical protein ACN47E_001297 [Coniothyrium glycines]
MFCITRNLGSLRPNWTTCHCRRAFFILYGNNSAIVLGLRVNLLGSKGRRICAMTGASQLSSEHDQSH